MRVMALIPARGGSVRLKGKNTETINGRTLVELAIRQAQACEMIDNRNIVVTSDSVLVREIAQRCGADIVVRPAHLSQGNNVIQHVQQHAYEQFTERNNLTFDAIVLLQPTSPMRTPEDIQGALQLFKTSGADAVVSVTEGADDVAFQVRHARRLERIPHCVVCNGAVFVLSVAAMQAGLHWFSPAAHLYGYEMPKDRSLDIDTQQDLEIARRLMAP